MRKILALGGHTEMKILDAQLQIDHDYQLTVASFGDIEFFIKKNNPLITLFGKDLTEYDFVWIHSSWAPRSVAYAVSLYLKHKKVAHTPVEHEGSKLVDMLSLSIENISIPNTYFSTTPRLVQRLDSIVGYCGYPFIMKSTRGTCGKDIFLIRDAKDFATAILDLESKVQYICQKFIPNTFDYRVIIGKGEMLSAEKRTRQPGEYRNNVFLGASEHFFKLCDVPKGVHRIAQKSSALLGLDWSGVDIVTSTKTGMNFVLELNRRPALTEGAVDVTAAFNHIVSLLKASDVSIEEAPTQ